MHSPPNKMFGKQSFYQIPHKKTQIETRGSSVLSDIIEEPALQDEIPQVIEDDNLAVEVLAMIHEKEERINTRSTTKPKAKKASQPKRKAERPTNQPRRKAGRPPTKCRICNIRFSTGRELSDHLATECPGEAPKNESRKANPKKAQPQEIAIATAAIEDPNYPPECTTLTDGMTFTSERVQALSVLAVLAPEQKTEIVEELWKISRMSPNVNH